jgi:hypothetical protein
MKAVAVLPERGDAELINHPEPHLIERYSDLLLREAGGIKDLIMRDGAPA